MPMHSATGTTIEFSYHILGRYDSNNDLPVCFRSFQSSRVTSIASAPPPIDTVCPSWLILTSFSSRIEIWMPLVIFPIASVTPWPLVTAKNGKSCLLAYLIFHYQPKQHLI